MGQARTAFLGKYYLLWIYSRFGSRLRYFLDVPL